MSRWNGFAGTAFKKSKPDEGGTISGIKGYDFKHTPKPEQYDSGEEKEFYAWRALFSVLLSAQYEQWDVLMGDVEKMGQKAINEAELKEIQMKLTMESDVVTKCTKYFMYDVAAIHRRRRQSQGFVGWDEMSDGVVTVHSA